MKRTSPRGVKVSLYPRGYAIVDKSDYKLVMQHKWRPLKGKWTTYAVASIDSKNVTMHVFIMHPKRGREVDHRDGDGLNNRRSNLRSATRSQNSANRSKWGSGRYKGVMRDGWKAYLSGRYLGTFDTAIEAARAYDEAARKAYGEFARLNFPRRGERSARN